MPVFIEMLLGGLSEVLGSYVGRVLLALSISFITYQGATVGLDMLVGLIKSNFGAMPSAIGSFVQYLWVDKAISVIFSATAAALAMKGAAGAVTKMAIKK